MQKHEQIDKEFYTHLNHYIYGYIAHPIREQLSLKLFDRICEMVNHEIYDQLYFHLYNPVLKHLSERGQND